VIDPDLRLSLLDRRHWTNWWRLVVPPRAWGLPAIALAIVDSDTDQIRPPRLIRLAFIGSQSRDPIDPETVPWGGIEPSQLAELARRLGVPAVIAIERSLIAALSQQLEPALHHRQDFVEQGLLALRVMKRFAGNGLWTSPELLALLPAPSYDNVQRTFDLLIPDDTAMIAYVIEDDRRRVHASLIACKRRGHVEHVTTHRAVRDTISETALARSWQTEYPRVLAAVEERLTRPSLGVFLERATLHRILTGPTDQLSRELSAKRVILDPAPTWLLGLLGGATVAAVAGRGARALAAMLPAAARGRANDLAQRASAAMRESGMHPFGLLGFDPLELWAQLQKFYRQ
jgi:hypothetical protein